MDILMVVHGKSHPEYLLLQRYLTPARAVEPLTTTFECKHTLVPDVDLVRRSIGNKLPRNCVERDQLGTTISNVLVGARTLVASTGIIR